MTRKEQPEEEVKEERPKEVVTIYRGYIVNWYEGNELVEPVHMPNGQREWQSAQELREKLQERINEADATFTMDYDMGGYIEEVCLKLAAFRKTR